MPKGLRGEKRPASVLGLAVHVARITTGEIEDVLEADDGKEKSAQALGQKRDIA